MTRFVSIQTNFSTGELDPLLRARVDLEAYQNALSEATNVVVQPQGGIRRRPGSKFLFSLPSSGAESAFNGVRLVPFEFSTSDSYMLCFTHNRMHVFRQGALVTAINGGSLDYLDTSSLGLTGARLSTLCWTQSADTLILTHQDIPPVQIVRGATNADWTGSVISFDSTPSYNFTSTVVNPTGTIAPDKVSGNITITASGNVFHDGRTGTAQAGASTTITLDASASATDDIYNGSTITITGGTGAGQIRVISDYVGSTKVATVSIAWSTTPDNTSTFSVSSQVGQYINAQPQGRVRISQINSTTSALVQSEFPFFNTSTIANNKWEIEFGYEPVWSSIRGYPRTVTFHEGRLYFGGSKSRPSTVWGSKVGLFFDFQATEGLDDDAVEATLDTNTFNAITDITSGRDLQVFTTGGEFYVPQEGLDPVTPVNFFLKSSTRNGSAEGIRTQQLESGTLFIQRQGKSLNEFAFTDTQLTYVTSKISLLSGHLLRSPTRMALRRSVATDENDLLFIVNGQDGSMVAFSLLRSQNVIAPSEFLTDGAYIDVGVDLTTIYTVVKRTIGSDDKWFVEIFVDNLLVDSAVSGTTGSGATLAHLPGKQVDIILDGTLQPADTVANDGSITFPRAATSTYQVGLDFTVKAVTMPVELKIASGTRLGFQKRIVEVNMVVKDTQHLKLNGIEVPFRNLNAPIFDNPVPEFTGTKTIDGIQGYSQEGKITLEQDVPLKLTVLGMEYKVSTTQGS
jgi:hypothetical protein